VLARQISGIVTQMRPRILLGVAITAILSTATCFAQDSNGLLPSEWYFADHRFFHPQMALMCLLALVLPLVALVVLNVRNVSQVGSDWTGVEVATLRHLRRPRLLKRLGWFGLTLSIIFAMYFLIDSFQVHIDIGGEVDPARLFSGLIPPIVQIFWGMILLLLCHVCAWIFEYLTIRKIAQAASSHGSK